MIDQIIGYCIIYVISSFSLIHWTNKKELDRPKYFSLLISLVLVVLIIPLYLIFEPNLALLIAYFVDTFLGAFLISKLYKSNFIDALKLCSWLIFGLMFLLYFLIIFVIFPIGIMIIGIIAIFF